MILKCSKDHVYKLVRSGFTSNNEDRADVEGFPRRLDEVDCGSRLDQRLSREWVHLRTFRVYTFSPCVATY
jgi:hypothetical protein